MSEAAKAILEINLRAKTADPFKAQLLTTLDEIQEVRSRGKYIGFFKNGQEYDNLPPSRELTQANMDNWLGKYTLREHSLWQVMCLYTLLRKGLGGVGFWQTIQSKTREGIIMHINTYEQS